MSSDDEPVIQHQGSPGWAGHLRKWLVCHIRALRASPLIDTLTEEVERRHRGGTKALASVGGQRVGSLACGEHCARVNKAILGCSTRCAAPGSPRGKAAGSSGRRPDNSWENRVVFITWPGWAEMEMWVDKERQRGCSPTLLGHRHTPRAPSGHSERGTDVLHWAGPRGGWEPTHPMFHRFGGVCSFLLSVIWCEDVNDGHEIDLLLRGTCMERTKCVWGTAITPGSQVQHSSVPLESGSRGFLSPPTSSHAVGRKQQCTRVCPSRELCIIVQDSQRSDTGLERRNPWSPGFQSPRGGRRW